MVRLRLPICDLTNDYTLCLQVIKDVYTLEYEKIYANQMQGYVQDDIDNLRIWKTNTLDKNILKRIKELVKLQKEINDLEEKIKKNISFKSNLSYEDIIKVLNNDYVLDLIKVMLGIENDEISISDIANIITKPSKKKIDYNLNVKF